MIIMMNSFIPWIGGKKLLRKRILDMFPKEYDRYIEVFGGAGWVLFGKEPGKELEVYNDIDGELVNLYRCIKYHCGELQRELDFMLTSREQFWDSMEQIKMRGTTDIQRAAMYFQLIKISFGASKRSFGVNKKNLRKTMEYLPEIQERLKNVVIENQSFEKIIKTYDREKALFYLDPPYYGTEKYYDSGFGEQEHEQLSEMLKQIKGKFILSYNDCPQIREKYERDFNIVEVERNNSLVSKNGESGRYKEIIIKNY